ncbi:hypothetical protein DH2020_021364 [Rehmannia glutinosa]|uniref:Uncharacterized protein n=1 Tax=Rehmannia glutinosa TaxID=99300 RepID=A0ABR0WEN9_REHGL
MIVVGSLDLSLTYREFYGDVDADDFIDWLHVVDELMDFRVMPDDRRAHQQGYSARKTNFTSPIHVALPITYRRTPRLPHTGPAAPKPSDRSSGAHPHLDYLVLHPTTDVSRAMNQATSESRVPIHVADVPFLWPMSTKMSMMAHPYSMMIFLLLWSKNM